MTVPFKSCRPQRLRTMPRRAVGGFALLAAAACIVLSGCETKPARTPVFKTSGTIRYRNQPVDGAFIVLHPRQPTSPDEPRPTAHVRADGSFEPTTFETADGAPAGEYVLTVQWHKLVQVNGEWTPGPNLLPAKYTDPLKSDIVIHVAEGENQLPPIELR